MPKSRARNAATKKNLTQSSGADGEARLGAMELKYRETAAALAASEERYALFTEAVGDVLFDWDVSGNKIYHSPNMFPVLGIATDEIKAPQDWIDHIDPNDAPRFWQALTDYFKHGDVRFQIEYGIHCSDGSLRWVRQHAIGLRDENGRVYRMTGAIGDITEAKRIREALDNSDERFRSLAQGSIQGLIIHKDGELAFANQAAADMHGYDADEMMGKRISDLVAPDSFDRVLAFGRAELAGDKAPNSCEYSGRRKDGSVFPVQLMANVIKWTDGSAIQCTLIDLSARKRAESLLRDAIESIPDGFVLFDRSDRLVIANQRFADFYPELAHMLVRGTTAEEMFRERARVGAVGKFDVPVEEYVQWRMEMRKRDGGTPSVHRHADGRWLRTTERKTSDGGIVAISTDVTELKQSEGDLAISKAQAETANRAKSEFLANMSHELRTPLNAIIGFSEAMEAEVLGPIGNESYREYVQDIHASGSHLLQIINDLLDLSKIEAGKLELDEQRVDINAVVSASIRIIRERAQVADIDLTATLTKPAPRIWADDRTCKQVVLNLLSNAVKFTPPGGSITVTTAIEDTGSVVIRVSDTGIGIPEAEMSKILEPFIQIESSLVRNHQGTGLGLPLSRAILDLHGGTLTLESALGEGTTATVGFPPERTMTERRRAHDAA